MTVLISSRLTRLVFPSRINTNALPLHFFFWRCFHFFFDFALVFPRHTNAHTTAQGLKATAVWGLEATTK